jgi:hypothetical protein
VDDQRTGAALPGFLEQRGQTRPLEFPAMHGPDTTPAISAAHAAGTWRFDRGERPRKRRK